MTLRAASQRETEWLGSGNGFRTGEAFPPIEVTEIPTGSDHKYRPTHGAHRFYCSVAVGFTEVPAVRGLDL